MDRVNKGIREELLSLARLEGIGRVRARVLYNSGLKNIEDLKHTPIEKLVNLPLIGPRIAKRIKEQLGGLVKSKEWERLSRAKEAEQQALTEYY